MKKYLYILIAVMTFSACESELDLTSPSQLTAAGFWDTEEGARTAQTGMYANLRSTAGNLWLLGEMRSDIWGGRTYESPANEALIESNITVSTAPFGGWAGLYTNIHRINDFLKNVPNVSFINEADKNHLLGQAYGLRALYYYTLLKTWGDVPIILEPLTTVDASALSKPRSSQTDVMAQIKSDIASSLSAFGSDNSFFEGQRIYWSKPATLALKGDVYIWSGNLLGGGNADFTEAKAALQQIASLGIELEPLSSLWGVENEANNEFIFAIQYKQDEASNIYNSLTGRSTEINVQYNDMGASMSDFVIAGANRYGQSEKTILLLDDNDDGRKDATFIRLYTDDNGGLGYSSYDESKYFGSIFNKFLGVVKGSERIFENDVPLYRYADVVLLLAEAKNLLGEDPSSEINQIRERAYGDNYNPLIHAYTNSTKVNNTNAILNERYKEFIGEGKRWWDLRRAGNSFVIDNISFLSTGDEYKLVLPITNDMIGRNPLLQQTTGYIE
ncbi:RagB/SusD family nutrient uptake outer membrane protein [Aestuariibaculum suncheonense]|uniref:RagB/SusD family nutrient uptake outer membrane protein n=1 Tax=Aestuariibaculum suncheonense TaxID=1028745 RepID=A0A8J6UAF9_9FLAO|nr:RagB/SusD family nutrient uptake outer membrane protein [Aestuariibaculum suncheonense]MBD0835258.1 RagB/SusD family nutrient uptake outer membrane protein [Aestuariibaculum suncheonense]